MITIDKAKAIAVQHLAEMEKNIEIPVQLTKVQEEPFGWVFFYQSKEYIDTGEFSSILAGNAPFIVDHENGVIHELGTAFPADVYIKEYMQHYYGHGVQLT